MMKTINAKHVHNNNNDTTVSERFLKNKLPFNKPSYNKHRALELYDTVDKDSPYHLTHAIGIIIDIKA